MKVTERDLRILKWIGEQFVVNVKELDQLLCFDADKHHLDPIGEYYVRDLVRRWKKAGIVQTAYPLKRGLHVFLTSQGVRITGLPFTPRTPSTSDVAHLTHHDGVNQIRLYLEQQAWRNTQVMSWVSERSLMQQQKFIAKEQPHQPLPHRPDAEIYTREECIAVEYEKAYKRPAKLKSVLHDFLFSDRYSRVFYFCETPAIQQSIARAVSAIIPELPLPQHEHLEGKVIPTLMPWYA